ncbi:MAG: DNA recombination protein RmuC [Rubrivivax sp.]|nr:DNA recombination protein RmuC [Rubrivivax sp.]MBK7262418.1 DNA recombination protein RmuC [Rubrivivax sp.]MBK8528651.1 DNA recombination protein RmuC [Rubrivivax sp.]
MPAPLLIVGALNLLLLVWLATRKADPRPLRELADELRRGARADTEGLERDLRDELGRLGNTSRQDLASFQSMLLTQAGDVARTQNEQIDSFRTQLAGTQQAVSSALTQATQALATQAQNARDAQDAALRRFGDTLGGQLRLLSEGNERRLTEMRTAVEARLTTLQEGNERKLEQMRATVDEKLHATLEQRLGESFKQVADRLEQVHKGLGEMQGLARDVGSLSRVLTGVKTRGVFGEMQLAALIEQIFTPDQYAINVATLPGSNERVEFALRLPGQKTDGSPLWLPIDAKFPREDYERLLDASERADAGGVETAAKAIEVALRKQARSIRDKYVAPPYTTDFALLFVPSEGLYAEVLRRPGLTEALQRDFKIIVAGPTTLLAMLNSLQMGFRTLALEKRSAEVWEVLGAVKTEFGKFGDALAHTRKKLQEATNTIDAAQSRSNVMTRRLKAVEALPEPRALELLPPDAVADDDTRDAVGA